MKLFIASISILLTTFQFTLFDFTSDSNIGNWFIVDDVVMGGRSGGDFSLHEEGHGVFKGRVSLENNGGFSSVRYRFEQIDVKEFNSFLFFVRGDGKRYQFRVKSDRNDRESYIAYFETSGEWERVEIPFADMVPQYRGRQLSQPNFQGQVMEEISFLIGNNKNETFQLEIGYLRLK